MAIKRKSTAGARSSRRTVDEAVDGRLEPSEQVFLEDVSAELGLEQNQANAIIALMRLKNAA